MKLPAAHAAQAPALRELRGILAKANKDENSDPQLAVLLAQRVIALVWQTG